MKKTLAIILCKTITLVCKLFRKNGTVYPGSIIYDYVDKNILKKITYHKTVIAVTGSSGKGSTTELIYHILKENNYSVVYNKSGSNGVLAAITLILNNCNIFGKFKKDILLLECDERHLKLIFEENQMTHLLITNITRDQPSRNGHPKAVFDDIKKAITPDTKLIINADDPLINSLKLNNTNIVTYGINDHKDTYKKPTLNTHDFQYCPICNKKLIYKFYHYGHLGNYECNYCNFKRDIPDYEATNLDLLNKTMLINNNKIKLNKDIFYATYYTLGAYAVCKSIGLTDEQILKQINENQMEAKRGKSIEFNNQTIHFLETKNENSLSYYQSLKYLTTLKTKKTIILGFDNVSRRYNFNDLSWLYDVDFELLNDKSIEKIIVIGRFKYDIKTRLEYTEINQDKIIVLEDLDNLVEEIKTSSKDIYSMVCFDMTAIIQEKIKGAQNGNN